MMRNIFLTTIVGLLFVTCQDSRNSAVSECDDLKYSISKIDDLSIDGNVDEWSDTSLFSVRFFANSIGDTPQKEDFAANMKLAWGASGLALLIEVTDDSIVEDATKGIFKGDCIEIFLSSKNGGNDMVQYVISPGLNTEPKTVIWDHRGTRKTIENKMVIDFKSVKTEYGYNIEVLLPLSQVGVEAKEGSELSLQVCVNNMDNESDEKTTLQWHFMNDTYINTQATQQLILSQNCSNKIDYTTRCYLIDFDSVAFKIFTDEVYNGEQLIIKNSGADIYKSVISSTKENVVLPILVIDSLNPNVCVFIGNKLIEKINTRTIYRKYNNTTKYAFEQYIRNMTYLYELNPPPKDGILFIGTSHFRFWKSLTDDMGDLPVYNNGFGGSQTVHVLHYINDVVINYAPKIIVYTEGANDISVGRSVDDIAKNTEEFVNVVHKALPDTRILILSYPDGLRRGRDKLLTVDSLFLDIANRYDFVEQVDLKEVFTQDNGEYIPDIFHPDNVHMNPKGYSFLAAPIKTRLEEIMIEN